VAATSLLAARAGIRVFATGGLGGVHRGAAASFDESADLTVLSRTPITLVSAGVKSILDIAATLERLETLGVPVVGFGTNRFPAFYLTDSGYDLDWRADSAAEIAAIMAARDQLGDSAALHDRVLSDALAAAREVRGKDVTPFLLDYFHSKTAGQSLTVNLDLVRSNIRLAAEIALAFTG
jgi:pseudouridine-5'-phosphate glycosidase